MRQARGDSQRSYLGRPARVSGAVDQTSDVETHRRRGQGSAAATVPMNPVKSRRREGPNIKPGGHAVRSMDGGNGS